MEIIIGKADLNQFENVMCFYYNLIDSMQNLEFKPLWKKDIYPTKQFIYNSIKKNELYIAQNDNCIIGAMVINQNPSSGYENVNWKVSAKNSEVIIIHALGVLLEYQGKGIAMQMVNYVINYCKDKNMKAIRLDVLEQNRPAQKLYTKMGFVFLDKIQLFYEDTGLTDFLLYELEL